MIFQARWGITRGAIKVIDFSARIDYNALVQGLCAFACQLYMNDMDEVMLAMLRFFLTCHVVALIVCALKITTAYSSQHLDFDCVVVFASSCLIN